MSYQIVNNLYHLINLTECPVILYLVYKERSTTCYTKQTTERFVKGDGAVEVWDLFNEYRERLDETHVRGEEMETGKFHTVVHGWIMNEAGQLLIQQRQPWKKGWPNMWDCSAAGSALAGETSEMAIIRETKEELGIDINISQAEIAFTVKFSRGFDDHWLIKQDVDINDLQLQHEEVADAKWATMEELLELVDSGDFIPYHILGELQGIIDSTISLKKATLEDADQLYQIQKTVFTPLFEKYKDYETSPVTQTFERFKERLLMGDYYKIFVGSSLIGSVHVYSKKLGTMRLHMINILEEAQGKGIAQQVMKRLEGMYPQASQWELDTVEEEKRNCYLYEKMGYLKTGDKWKVKDNMSLVHYTKTSNLNHLESI